MAANRSGDDDDPVPVIRSHVPFLLGGTAALACVLFAGFTGHIWEDYFITFRSSLNLARGHGLVFQVGERVHTFTSPLGTLLPALFALGDGENVAIRALWGFRLLSALTLGSAVWLVARTLLREKITREAILAAGFAWALDPKIIDFSINGMESALLIFFVALTWHGFATGTRLVPCALGLAGLQWTRPDGGVFFAVLAAASWFFGTQSREDRGKQIDRLGRAGALGLLLYLPWIAFAWIYYGSPVPHTILAKVSHLPAGELAVALLLYPWRLLFGHVAAHDLFLPAYHFFGGWPDAMAWPARILTLGAAIAWTWPRVAATGRMTSAAFFLGGFYLEYIPRSPWHYPGWQSLAWIAWIYLLAAAWKFEPAAGWAKTIPRASFRVTALLIVILQATTLGLVAWQMRVQQCVIENGHRREIGRWLAKEAEPHDTVFLECLGYIGYFSQLTMLDYPGLSSPEVVATRRAGNQSFAQIIQSLHPEWIVLRPDDAGRVFAESPPLGKAYQLMRTFNARPAIDAHAFLPGRGYLNFDAVFLVYRRMHPARPSA